MARAPKVEAPEEAEQDLTAYIGVDPVYMNYSDDRNKPFKAEPEEDEDGNDNLKVVEAEETAYANQAAIRENSGQDPDTGEALETDPDAEYEYKRGSYTHEAQWSPSQATSNNTGVSVAEMSDPNAGADEGDKGDGRGTGSPTPPAPPVS